jgi:outer membrane protein OmpA-like peptidoglycan-associated protein
MRYRFIATLAAAVLLCSGTALAASITTLAYPEKQKVPLVFGKTPAAPEKAKITGEITYENGQAKITVKFSGMEPAVLFGGDMAAYVVWAVARSAAPENLGELIVTKKGASGSQLFSTPKKDFGLMVTVEPYYLVGRPFDLVLATSAPKDPKKFAGSNWVFDDFRPGPKAGVTSIATLKYEDKTAVPIRQAEAVLGLIDRLGAGDVNPNAVKSATVALGEAKAVKDQKAVSDAARRSISSSAEALRDWGRTRDELAASQAAAKTAAEKAALEQKAAMQIEGYTDNVGSDATNMKLSEDRAKAVRDFFETQGIPSNRLTYVGKGPADPVAPNDTAEGRAKNRRVEIVSSDPQL